MVCVLKDKVWTYVSLKMSEIVPLAVGLLVPYYIMSETGTVEAIEEHSSNYHGTISYRFINHDDEFEWPPPSVPTVWPHPIVVGVRLWFNGFDWVEA